MDSNLLMLCKAIPDDIIDQAENKDISSDTTTCIEQENNVDGGSEGINIVGQKRKLKSGSSIPWNYLPHQIFSVFNAADITSIQRLVASNAIETAIFSVCPANGIAVYGIENFCNLFQDLADDHPDAYFISGESKALNETTTTTPFRFKGTRVESLAERPRVLPLSLVDNMVVDALTVDEVEALRARERVLIMENKPVRVEYAGFLTTTFNKNLVKSKLRGASKLKFKSSKGSESSQCLVKITSISIEFRLKTFQQFPVSLGASLSASAGGSSKNEA